MFIIEPQYMNECFRRTLAERTHSIHCNDSKDVLEYLVEHYDFELGASHVVTNSGHLFEIKIALDNRYVTLVSCD